MSDKLVEEINAAIDIVKNLESITGVMAHKYGLSLVAKVLVNAKAQVQRQSLEWHIQNVREIRDNLNKGETDKAQELFAKADIGEALKWLEQAEKVLRFDFTVNPQARKWVGSGPETIWPKSGKLND